MKIISIKIPEWLLKETDNIATKEHVSRSQIIREALKQYVHNYKYTNQHYKRIIVKHVILS